MWRKRKEKRQASLCLEWALCLSLGSFPGHIVLILEVASLWNGRRGNHCALICWHEHLMINYGCAGGAHQRLRKGILRRLAFLFRITLQML